MRITLFITLLTACATSTSVADVERARAQGATVLAVVGDYGSNSNSEASVATMVHSWRPDYVVTTGDNNYPNGEVSTIDANIGKYYQRYIGFYRGAFGQGSPTNRFFPSPGNHDWNTGTLAPYTDYFTLPGNERYYDVALGLVHLFVLDSDSHEPDGITATSPQAMWLKSALAASRAPWKFVVMHHPPFSSGRHGSEPTLQWPFKEWGASAVLAGHDHTYERLQLGRMTYIVNGLGGKSLYPMSITPVPGSQKRYNQNYGAMRVIVTAATATFEFITIRGELIDRFTLQR